MHPNIAILAGGISSRMKKQAPSKLDPSLRRDVGQKSKAMIGVGRDGRPFLNYLLYNIEQAGYKNVVIVIGERDESIRGYYQKKENRKPFRLLNISYALQSIPAGREKPLGTADALFEALKVMSTWRGQKFTACNSDNLYSIRALSLLLRDSHDNAMIEYDCSALRFDHDRIKQFSVIRRDKDGFLENIIEKPSADEIEASRETSGRVGVSMNFFRFSYDHIFPFLETVPLHPIRQEKELPLAVKMMVQRYPRCMFTIPLVEHVPDLTTQSDIHEVKAYLAKAFRHSQDE